MKDLKKRFSLEYLLSSKSMDYRVGFHDCKVEVLKLLKKDLHNLDLSTDSCDSRYIKQIERL